MTEAELRAHLEADPPAGHGVAASAMSEMSMAAMVERHDAMHTSDAGHAHDMSRTDGDVTTEDDVREVQVEESVVQIRDAVAREIDMRIMPWGVVINSVGGTEEFARGAFEGTDPSKVLLVGPEHERQFALGHNGGPAFVRRPVGKGLSIDERDDGAYMTFRVARTTAGDDVLALVADGITPGVSVEFAEIPGGTSMGTRSGRRHRVQNRVRLEAVTTTYRPAYGERAAVLAVRSQEEGAGHMTEAVVEAPVSGAEVASQIDAAFAKIEARAEAQARAQEALNTKFLERFEKADEQARASIEIPNPTPEANKPKVTQGDWIQMVVRLMTGERIPEAQMRTLDDVITTDNAGVVPPTFLTELIGVIDARRPFLSTTRRLETPPTGLKLTVPVIAQRPTAAKQSSEKQEVSSQKTIINSEDFNAITIAGAGDLSIQLIKRSSPSFLNLWVELLAEAYAIEAEDQAILALLNATGGVGAATSLDPENLALGSAYIAAFDAIRRPPDTIWLSTEAVGAFIDAKATTTNQPLYSALRTEATAAGGIAGQISGLRAVHVPALDAHGAYAIVGPSSGFAWAEDGTFTLQVDVPAKAGRDVALVGMLWPAPWYPAAFTTYNVAS